MIQPVINKGYTEVIKEWDEIAEVRLNQIENGQDLSFKYVLAPTILDLLGGCNLSKVVDFGCGTGTLTKMIACKSDYIIGVDISKKNIELARENSRNFNNIDFVNIDIESFVSKVKKGTFTTAVAGMTLMTVLNLDKVLETTRAILKSGANFVFTITHPCFWPLYWDYAKEEWFDYAKEIPIEANFKTSLANYDRCVTTHVHRPLSMYFNSLIKNGFSINKIIEPMPSHEIQKAYPTKWVYPRFLGVQCMLNTTKK